MFNHVGDAAFDLLVKVAQEADAVILPVGCPVCVTSESQIPTLPEQLREDGVHLVRNGRDLLAVIRGS
jgi:hydrogenase maturation factor